MWRIACILSLLITVTVNNCWTETALAQEGLKTTAPDYFQNLIETGNVELSFHDPRKHEVKTGGKAYFNYKFHHTVKFRFKWRRADLPGKLLLTISPSITDARVTVSHTVSVPNSYRNPRMWTTRLVKHEFDHVALSSDPRVLKLLEHLVRNLGPIERTVGGSKKPDRDLCLKIINEECDSRRGAVVALVQANYRILDNISQHGKKRIPDRSEFFRHLFDKKNIDAQEFQFLPELLDLLDRRDYREMKLHYKKEPNL